uniref:TRI27 protein n=1 Tax=Pseudonaja textilis TaxID=8673 RepID=A0A670YXZ8_PSETE
ILFSVFRKELICSICLDRFHDPVSIHCGHTFCQACIIKHWDLMNKKHFHCPKCRATSRKRILKPNRELGNIQRTSESKLSEGLHLQAIEGLWGEPLCEKHREPLKVFCKEDCAFICLVCAKSQKHRGHLVRPVEEAAQDYKEDIKAERRKIAQAFQQLRSFLEERENGFLAKLSDLEKQQDESSTRLSNNISFLNDLICDLEKQYWRPAGEFLKVDILGLFFKNINYCGCFSLNLSIFAKMLRCQSKDVSPVSVTLDPRTANPHLFLSLDQKTVTHRDHTQALPDNPERFDAEFFVLGCESFCSGKHSWVVNINQGQNWAIGIAQESVRRKGSLSLNPQQGVWAVQQCWGQMQALTSRWTPLFLLRKPTRIRVYLDYEGGWVAFFDAELDAPIFTFPPTSFKQERIHPWFWVASGSQLTLCP